MHFDQENGTKPHFGPFLALIGPFFEPENFFSALGKPLGTRYCYSQPQCAKLAKTNAF